MSRHYWEIICTTPEHGDVLFRVSEYGDVFVIEPDSSPFATMGPLSIDGFATPGSFLLPGEEPAVTIQTAIENGVDVSGMALAIRTAHVTVVASAKVTEPLRLVQFVDDEPAGAENLLHEDPWEVGEWFQRVTDGPRDYDDNPAVITVRQALKMSAIVHAAQSNELYRDALYDVSWFLTCVAMPASGISGSASMTPAEAWAKVEKWPWPRPSGAGRSKS